MREVTDKYDEIFDVEIEGWCYGITHYPGEIFPGLVHRVIKELSESFAEAVRHNLVFDLVKIARRFSKAAKYLVPEKEIAFSILVTLPHPRVLDEDGQYVVAMLLDQAEREYGGALDRMQRKWSVEPRRVAA